MTKNEEKKLNEVLNELLAYPTDKLDIYEVSETELKLAIQTAFEIGKEQAQ